MNIVAALQSMHMFTMPRAFFVQDSTRSAGAGASAGSIGMRLVLYRQQAADKQCAAASYREFDSSNCTALENFMVMLKSQQLALKQPVRKHMLTSRRYASLRIFIRPGSA